MALRNLEAAILAELHVVTGNRKIRQKDIMEWSTGTVEAHGEEKLAFLPSHKVNVAYVEPAKKQKAQAQGAFNG